MSFYLTNNGSWYSRNQASNRNRGLWLVAAVAVACRSRGRGHVRGHGCPRASMGFLDRRVRTRSPSLRRCDIKRSDKIKSYHGRIPRVAGYHNTGCACDRTGSIDLGFLYRHSVDSGWCISWYVSRQVMWTSSFSGSKELRNHQYDFQRVPPRHVGRRTEPRYALDESHQPGRRLSYSVDWARSS